MCTLLYNLPVVEHDNLVRLPYSGETVGYDYHGSVAKLPVKSLLDLLIGSAVYPGCGLVNDKNAGGTNDCSGETQLLPLA